MQLDHVVSPFFIILGHQQQKFIKSVGIVVSGFLRSRQR